MILSVDSPEVRELKYKNREIFLFKASALEEDGWDSIMLKNLKDKQVIVRINGYEINIDGHLEYGLSFISPDYKWDWWVPQEMLDNSFIYLGDSFEKARFVLIDD